MIIILLGAFLLIIKIHNCAYLSFSLAIICCIFVLSEGRRAELKKEEGSDPRSKQSAPIQSGILLWICSWDYNLL